MMDSEDLQLNVYVSGNNREEGNVKKNVKHARYRKRKSYELKREAKRRLEKPRQQTKTEQKLKTNVSKGTTKEKSGFVNSVLTKTESKLKTNVSKETPKEKSGFVNSVLRGEVIPKVNSSENKLVFPKLAKRNSYHDQKRKEKHSKGKLAKRKDNTKSKAVESQGEKTSTTTNGGNFASFIRKSKTAASAKSQGKVTSSGAERKFARKPNNNSAFPKSEFKFGFSDLAADVGEKRTVEFADDDVSEKPKVNFPTRRTNFEPEKPKVNFPRPRTDSARRRREKTASVVSEAAPPRNPSNESNDVPEGFSDLDNEETASPGAARGRPRFRKKKAAFDRNTSLFVSNPEIPLVPRRAVRPVHETVFSDQNFSHLPIHKFQVSNLAALGLEKMTTVQGMAVPVVLQGHDALVRSQTGSGKTLAYALPLVELLQRQQPPLTRADGVRALVVLPTRELALQTYEWFLKLVKPFMRLVPGCLVGGEKRKSEKARLRKGVTILVGTPGRVLDHVQHTRSLRLDRVQYLVLDEADCLLDMGYERDIASLIAELDTQSKPLLSKEVLAWSRKTLKPTEVTEGNASNNEKIKAPGYVSQDSGAEDEDSSEETDDDDLPVPPTKEVPKEKHSGMKIAERKLQEDETSDYDPEERADEVQEFLEEEEEEEDEEEDEEEEDDEKDDEEDDEKKDNEEGKKGKRRRRQTVLLSATLTPAVERLAGLTLHDPLFVDAADEDDAGDAPMHGDAVVIPDSLQQSYIVVPAKLRLVTLSSFIVWKCKFTEERKMLLFCATQDMVDYLTELLTVGLSRKDTDEDLSSDEEDADDSFNIGVDFFRLHGSMNQNERTLVFQTFRAAECGVLLCTDVAARGLDLPHVDWIVQLTAPGCLAEYVHRVGRTARIGAQGSALLFLLPAEADFVELLQDKRIALREVKMEKSLKKLALANSSTDHTRQRSASVEEAATALQLLYERAVLGRQSLHDSAIKAYVSYVRFYASYPKEVRDVFSFKALHLGHHAKSFALRDPPKAIAGIGRSRFYDDSAKRSKQRGDARRPGKWGSRPGAGSRPQGRKRTRDLVLSEFASGLEPLKKRKRNQ